jgi:hypothetical protein
MRSGFGGRMETWRAGRSHFQGLGQVVTPNGASDLVAPGRDRRPGCHLKGLHYHHADVESAASGRMTLDPRCFGL